jgi:hypothetical protein
MTSLEVALRPETDDLRTRGARFALARIRELGFHRNRDLTRALDELLA